VRILKKDL